MNRSIQMISFRLNCINERDKKIWDHLKKNGANRSQLIKELLLQSINENKEKIGKKNRHEFNLEEYLSKISQDLESIREIKRSLIMIEKKLAIPSREKSKLDQDEENLLKTIFEENPIEFS